MRLAGCLTFMLAVNAYGQDAPGLSPNKTEPPPAACAIPLFQAKMPSDPNRHFTMRIIKPPKGIPMEGELVKPPIPGCDPKSDFEPALKAPPQKPVKDR